MKAVILAGGKGTRITEESRFRPKPMIEIGPHPLIWHIMKTYAAHGITDFVVCCGYKGFVIKEYFANYYLHNSDVTFDMGRNEMQIHHTTSEPWRVTVVETGLETMTGGRLKRIEHHLEAKPFCMTYGDGLANIDITKLLAFHRAHGKLATMTTVPAEGRYGAAVIDKGDSITAFQEKASGGTWINGGYFVLEPRVLDYIDGDDTHWEIEPMRSLVGESEVMAYRHSGFWMAMDHLREKEVLDQLWTEGRAPWKVWP
jgi:glucose-1-phosphate cytidylyltransferase